MAYRIYIVPVIGTGTREDRRRPKYFMDGTVSSDWTGADYGIEPWMFVSADLSVSDDLLVTGQPDAFALPFDLSQPLTAQQVTNVQNKLEAIKLPADWVTTSLTFQQVFRVIAGVLTFMQRLAFLTNNVSLFSGGATLTSTFNSLPVAIRQAMQQAAADLSLDSTGISGNTQLRVILRSIGQQYAARPYQLGGVSI